MKPAVQLTDNNKVDSIKLADVRVLKRLFDQALRSDFTYFSEAYLDQVQRQNSLTRLGVASLRPDRLLLALKVDQVLSGYVIAKLSRYDSAYIYWLFVKPECRGRGLGNFLLNSALEVFAAHNIRRIELVTHDRKDFYIHHGFDVDQFRPKFIDGVDIYMMSRDMT